MTGSERPRAVLVDVEGTTTPIDFVHGTLFPFAEARLEEACARAAADPRIAEAVERLREEHARQSLSEPGLGPFGGAAAYARRLMREDRKSTGLKALQGVIWEDGYRSGALVAPVFPDVPQALERWERAGVRRRVFSSGSVLAQKLLFAHTDHGDLTGYFEGYHDTTTGPKREAASYGAIARAAGLPAETVLFLSDVVEELDAARDAGMRTGLVLRPGNAPVATSSGHPSHRDLLELA